MGSDVTPYTNLITSEHAASPNFVATVAGLCQPAADLIALLQSFNLLFDLDVAVGQQLDYAGEWVGVSRNLKTPITGVYFSFDTTGVGFDQGTWLGPYDPISGLEQLPDDAYRQLLYASIAKNHWDGTIPGMYSIWQLMFGSSLVGVQDRQNMTIDYILFGGALSAVQYALLTQGYLNIKPVGVTIDNYVTPSVTGPYFGFDVESSTISGFDVGGWGIYTPST